MKIGKINRQSIAISSFTSGLDQYPGMPSELFVIGTLPKIRPPVVAVVGSRKPTAYGVEVTTRFTQALARQGIIILSGLALGVDSIAHQACLQVGGTTIAVLAAGLHTVSPRSHYNLAQQIVQTGGALISEYAPGVEARDFQFLARNRLVSGLADAILVTEAAHRSGTFSTVSHAMSQNKDIFAVPGPITSLMSAGPNRMLQTQAYPACQPEDILQVLLPAQTKHAATTQLSLGTLGDTPLESQIIKLVQSGLRDGDELLQRTQASAGEFSQTLSLMELKGTLRALGGNKWCT